MSGPATLEQHDCKVSKLVGRSKTWLAGAGTAGGNHLSKRSAVSPALTRVADTSPSPGWRSVWMASSYRRYFT